MKIEFQKVIIGNPRIGDPEYFWRSLLPSSEPKTTDDLSKLARLWEGLFHVTYETIRPSTNEETL